MMSRPTMNTGGATFSSGQDDCPDEKAPQPVRDRPCHILVLGDFSGRSHRGLDDPASLTERKLWEITRDNFDDVFVRLKVTLDLAVADQPIVFQEYDDLHPDYLYERVDQLFSQFRALKRKLNKADSFEAAAREIQSWGVASPTPSQKSPTTPDPTADQASQDNVLEMLLHSPRAQQETEFSVQSLIQEIVAPYVVPAEDPRKADLLNTLDQATSHLMRKILHSSAFQDIESGWRGLYWLLKQLELDANLRLFLVDISLSEIIADNEAHEDQTTALHKLLLEHRVAEGSVPFSLMVADYQLQDQVEHCEALANLASIAADSHALLLSGASERIAGCPSLAQIPYPEHWYLRQQSETDFDPMWNAIREQEYSRHVVLTCPRFMLRLPYGDRTSPLDSFEFEELPEQGQHDYYLWGNGAWLLAAKLGNDFARGGWDETAVHGCRLTQLPLHVYKEHGESRVMPCAEIAMTDNTAGALLQYGLMPIRSVRDEDSVVVGELRSLCLEGNEVAGPWADIDTSA